jgi:hypothetical protein
MDVVEMVSLGFVSLIAWSIGFSCGRESARCLGHQRHARIYELEARIRAAREALEEPEDEGR